MANNNSLIRKLLRLITPEEIREIATKSSEGGRFISVSELLRERILKRVYRDFSQVGVIEDILDEHDEQFDLEQSELEIMRGKREQAPQRSSEDELARISPVMNVQMRATGQIMENEDFIELNGHIKNSEDGENMSSFIIHEKARLKNSQFVLKQKEILKLYEKNSNIDVGEVRIDNKNPGTIGNKGILINKKQ